jgi:hypothetical protein
MGSLSGLEERVPQERDGEVRSAGAKPAHNADIAYAST